MKCFILLVAVLAICVVQFVAAEDIDQQWTQFKKDHNRVYVGEEEAKRKDIFVATVKMINEHNEKFKAGEVGYSQGINQFADRFPSELNRGKKPGLRVTRQLPGADKCSIGPGYWCKNLATAKECKAENLCLVNQWNGKAPNE